MGDTFNKTLSTLFTFPFHQHFFIRNRGEAPSAFVAFPERLSAFYKKVRFPLHSEGRGGLLGLAYCFAFSGRLAKIRLFFFFHCPLPD